ncbi:TPA: hypothetical protein RNS99_003044 [Stenotrophomonas maltophilia]|uniref:hypothetical protein n=1 Tax=Stenotrophomonas maltophilia TaxID=40324 RepID=UPI000A596D5F|nr:hypothetical protein [Stenotrophomonas maltophilia]MBN5088305.1 hypothetical protein [Stenotrophomonas maltophilia]MCU1207293.1 hypothetical protein [Stenotrophomonas maltophilia]MDH2062452.1 hypothetical protein [Stenotrophomonas maltophilia]HDX0900716.1 hypothetical protein [Stenotrophomonas maltophilia]HDX0918766.1 hypothetical protein [Stenotrophomonas maltophilia]
MKRMLLPLFVLLCGLSLAAGVAAEEPLDAHRIVQMAPPPRAATAGNVRAPCT